MTTRLHRGMCAACLRAACMRVAGWRRLIWGGAGSREQARYGAHPYPYPFTYPPSPAPTPGPRLQRGLVAEDEGEERLLVRGAQQLRERALGRGAPALVPALDGARQLGAQRRQARRLGAAAAERAEAARVAVLVDDGRAVREVPRLGERAVVGLQHRGQVDGELAAQRAHHAAVVVQLLVHAHHDAPLLALLALLLGRSPVLVLVVLVLVLVARVQPHPVLLALLLLRRRRRRRRRAGRHAARRRRLRQQAPLPPLPPQPLPLPPLQHRLNVAQHLVHDDPCLGAPRPRLRSPRLHRLRRPHVVTRGRGHGGGGVAAPPVEREAQRAVTHLPEGAVMHDGGQRLGGRAGGLAHCGRGQVQVGHLGRGARRHRRRLRRRRLGRGAAALAAAPSGPASPRAARVVEAVGPQEAGPLPPRLPTRRQRRPLQARLTA